MRLYALYQKIFGDTIPAGPFKGMRHSACEIFSAKGIGAKILGTYELELREVIEDICKRDNDVVIDVGAAEGYYAVGLALRKRSSKIIAFEANPEAQVFLRDNAAKNDVASRIEILGFCDKQSLSKVLNEAKSPLLFMDCEGGELDLLDPAAILPLSKGVILVEIHDFMNPRIGETIRQRFANSHRLREIVATPRKPDELPQGPLSMLAPLTKHKGAQWMAEGRPKGMSWFYLTPKSDQL